MDSRKKGLINPEFHRYQFIQAKDIVDKIVEILAKKVGYLL